MPSPMLDSAGEKRRLQSVFDTGLLDGRPMEALDELVRSAANATGARMVALTLVAAEEVHLIATVGLPRGVWLSREKAFCSFALGDAQRPFVVVDAKLDPRFADAPIVVGQPGIRSYAGVPLRDGDGMAIGTLCVLDTVPGALLPASLLLLDRPRGCAYGAGATTADWGIGAAGCRPSIKSAMLTSASSPSEAQ